MSHRAHYASRQEQEVSDLETENLVSEVDCHFLI